MREVVKVEHLFSLLNTGKARPGVFCPLGSSVEERWGAPTEWRATSSVKGLDHFTFKERLRELGLVNLEGKRFRMKLMGAYVYLRCRCKESRARLFSVVPLDRTRGSGHKLQHGNLPLNLREALEYCVDGGALVQIAQNCCEVLFFGDIQKLNEKGPGHPALDVLLRWTLQV